MHLCQLMIYVMTLNQLFWTLTEEKILPFMRLFWEEKQKYLQSFQNKATYHLMNSELFLMFHITFDEISTTLYANLVKVDIVNTCGAMICSYFGIAFLLFFMEIENTV